MRDINDDMDDLFRRAADGYPLNTKGADWGKVYNSLRSEAGTDIHYESKKKQRRFLWLLLLLLPLGFALNKYAFQNHTVQKGTTPVNSPVTSSPQQKDIASSGPNQESIANETKPLITKKSQLASPKFIENKKDNVIAFKPDEKYVSQLKYISGKKSLRKWNKTNDLPDRRVSNDFDVAKNINVTDEGSGKDLRNTENTPTNIANTGKVNVTDPKNVGNSNMAQVNNTDSDDPKTALITENANSIKNIANSKKNKRAISQKSRPHYFYIGFVAGPDFSTVKLDKIYKTGYTIGALAGHRFNKNISIESGIL
jgi:hypothetical protein